MDLKVNFLQKKWGRKRPDLEREAKEWQGVRYGDQYLKEKREEEGRDSSHVPLVYGEAVVTEAHKAILSLPSKFCVFESVTEHKMKVAANVLGAKVAWELHAKKTRVEDRKQEGEVGGEGEWREEEEVIKQEEKNIYDKTEGSINFRKRYVTDIPTCRRLAPPKSLPVDQAIILENMKNRIAEATKQYLKNCDKKGIPLVKNISKMEEDGIKEIKSDKENAFLNTDKSGWLAAQRRDFYVEGMAVHLEGDTILTWEEQCSTEKRLTGHTLQFARALGLGDRWDRGGKHWDRVEEFLKDQILHGPTTQWLLQRSQDPY